MTRQLINPSTVNSFSSDTNNSVNTDESVNTNPPIQEQRKTETVKLIINSIGSYDVDYQEGDTGWNIMKRAAAKYHFDMTYQVFDFGIYIISIAGIEPEYGSYWALYYNANYSIVGIQDLIIQPNNTITWQVESWM